MKLLVLQHVSHEHPGYISQYAHEKEIILDIVELWKPYTIPNTSKYGGLIIMGGPMGAYENYPSRDDEIHTIKNALGNIPILGFCLGSQLLAYALGTDVHPNIQDGKKIKEVGYFQVDLTKDGKKSKILKNLPSPLKVLQWHGDVFDLPKDATLLASSPLCLNQAFSYKNAYGFLFHFEFTPDMISGQIEIDKKWIHEDNEINEKFLLNEEK
jgi:GMP synthase-like glutamine amidotransferase